MTSGRRSRPVTFAGRPLALRRRLLEILQRVGRATAAELSAAAYSGRVCRSRPPSCRPSELNVVRRALSRMRAKGLVVEAGRCRRQKLFELAGRTLVLTWDYTEHDHVLQLGHDLVLQGDLPGGDVVG